MMGKNETVVQNSQEEAYSGKSEPKHLFRQTMTALGPIFGAVACGMTAGYSAVLLPQITPDNSTGINSTQPLDYLNLNELTVRGINEMSWIAASAALPMAPGCWIGGAAMEKLGRKLSLILVSPVFCAGWLIVALAPNFTWLMIGRILLGLCCGVFGPLGPVFIAETSEPRLRGFFTAGISFAIAFGILVSHGLGTWLHWRITGILCGAFPLLCLILSIFSPESPTWLMKRRNYSRARKAWIILRGEHCEEEFEALESSPNLKEVNTSKELMPFHTKSSENTPLPSSWKDVIRSRIFLAPLFILNVFFFTMQFSGINAVTFYSVTLFEEVTGRENAHSATLVLDLVRLISSVVACWFTKIYPRKILVVISGIGSALSMLFLGGSLLFNIGTPWLPVCFLLAFTFASSIGLVPLPWLLCGELFAAEVRGLGSGISSGFAFMCFFVVVKTAPAMMKTIGPPWTYGSYGVITLLGTIFLCIFLPETKDKTLKEIEDEFIKR